MRSSLRYFLSLLIFLASCQSDIKTVEKITTYVDVNAEAGANVSMLYSEDAHVKARLTAPVLVRHNANKPYSEMPAGLKVLFYDDTLNIISRLTAGYGIRYEKDGKMTVRKNVIVVNVKGEQLNTEELVWDDANKKISSTKFCKITTKDEVLYGDGMTADQDFTNYHITKIRGTIKLKDSVFMPADSTGVSN